MLATACTDDGGTGEETPTETSDATGDGDGDPTTGDGDGDPNCGPGVEVCPNNIEGAPFELISAAIEGDCLTLEVSYSGGCADHTYSPCWGEFFLESDPVQTDLVIIHDDMDDPCDGILQDTWTVDLTVLKQAWQDSYQSQNGTIILNLEGESVQYDF